MPDNPLTPPDLDTSAERFRHAVETFIDLYKFVMSLAIGNCFRSLAQRQIQFKLDHDGGLLVHLGNVSVFDWLMFTVVLLFIARFFFGDMAYWKAYKRHNKKIHTSDAINLLLNSFALTYMSFFIGYNGIVAIIFVLVLAADVVWGAIRWGDKRFRTSEGPQVEFGVVVSFIFIVAIVILVGTGTLPHQLSDGQPLSKKEGWWIFGILAVNNLVDLFVNGGRYVGLRDKGRGVLRLVMQD